MGRNTAAYSLTAFNISIHPPREGWDLVWEHWKEFFGISIHPPREGWDDDAVTTANTAWDISIHPPREGWDERCVICVHIYNGFQSTHPVRGGTNGQTAACWKRKFQSTHPVRGGTGIAAVRHGHKILFQSTHPVRGGTPTLRRRPRRRPYFNPPTP